MGLIALDTSAIIALLNSRDTHHDAAKAEFQEILAGGDQLVLSAVTLAELLVGPLKHNKDAGFIEFFLSTFGVGVLPVTEQIARQGAQLRASRGIKLPDVLILATAVDVKAEAILTADAKWPEDLPVEVRCLARKTLLSAPWVAAIGMAGARDDEEYITVAAVALANAAGDFFDSHDEQKLRSIAAEDSARGLKAACVLALRMIPRKEYANATAVLRPRVDPLLVSPDDFVVLAVACDMLGSCLWYQYRDTEAEPYLLRAARAGQQTAAFKMGILRGLQDRPSEAEEYFISLTTDSSLGWSAQLLLANVAMQRGDGAKALAMLDALPPGGTDRDRYLADQVRLGALILLARVNEAAQLVAQPVFRDALERELERLEKIPAAAHDAAVLRSGLVQLLALQAPDVDRDDPA